MTITGTGTMLRRPIGMMIDPLRNLGVQVRSNGYLPITVQGPLRGGETDVEAYVSSQFLTGLLMSLPLAEGDTILHVEQPNSLPYLAVTVDLASKFRIRMEHNGFREFFIPGGQHYHPAKLHIEGDWSSAAFMLVAGAIAGEVTAKRMNTLSLQADLAIIQALTKAGAVIITTPDEITVRKRELTGFDFDATQRPDLFPILAVLGANCEGTTHIRGVNRLVYKESNRAEAIVSEYTKLGMDVALEDDVMTVRGGSLSGGTIDSCNDHRIAMAAAIAALAASGPVTITNAQAVTKSYPRFWDDLDSIIRTKHEQFRAQFQNNPFRRVARPRDRRHDRRNAGRHSLLGAGPRSRPRTPPQYGDGRHYAPARTRPAGNRIGHLQRTHGRHPADHPVPECKHETARLCRLRPSSPSVTCRPRRFPQIRRLQSSRRRRHVLRPDDRRTGRSRSRSQKLLPGVRFSTRLTEIDGMTDSGSFERILNDLRLAGDTAGGVVEIRAQGVAAGTGEPFFDSIESTAAHLIFPYRVSKE